MLFKITEKYHYDVTNWGYSKSLLSIQIQILPEKIRALVINYFH